ncbi:MAG: EAL domain-containing protein [Legionella sp.]
MDKPVQRVTPFYYKQFKFIWVLLTLVLLSLSFYLNWQISYARSHRDLNAVATQLSNAMDSLMEDLFQEVYALPLYGQNLPRCDEDLLQLLDRITINNLRISGITISDNTHQTICSTLRTSSAFAPPAFLQARVISGPFKLSVFDEPIYVIQQKMGSYYISIILFSSVLERTLKTPNLIASAVTLFNQQEQKNIISIERNKLDNWILSSELQKKSQANKHLFFVNDPLQSINGFSIVAFANNTVIYHNLWLRELLAGLFTLLASYLLYLFVDKLISEKHSLGGLLKSAVKNEEFYPEYQPVFNAQLNAFSGIEVLLRWKNNEDTIILPDLFVQEAERNGLIIPITLQILAIAFYETQHLINSRPYFHIAINLSSIHFTDPDFFSKCTQLIHDYAIPAQQIIFEITERELLNKDNPVFRTKMLELRNTGYSLAVDDFGTGHASISYLQHFPFNYLKIDKLFIQAIGTKAITESLNATIIHMAKDLKLHIIAEGVETAEQVEYLKKNEVYILQGWYFSKALSIEQLVDLLQGEHDEAWD